MPGWARPTIQKLVDKKLLLGNEKGELGLTEEMLKIYVVNDRSGLYD
jgi:N-acetylmuramoyl-L-alanine amidase